MFFAGQEVKNPLASKLASAFRPFDPGIFQLVYLYSTTERSFLARNTSVYDKKMTFVTFFVFFFYSTIL